MTVIKRKIKILIFFIIFIIIAPIVILYAKGDIFINGLNILQTGGIYVAGAPIGSEVFLNSKSIDTTSFFTRNIFIRNLRPGIYNIEVKNQGYNTWFKTIKVNNNLVSDADIFMLPEKVETRKISEYVLSDAGSTSTIVTKIKNQEYIDILSLFKNTATKILKSPGTSSIDFKSNLGTASAPIMDSKLGLWKEKNKIYVEWFGKNETAPKYMCDQTFDCLEKKLVTELTQEPKRINYLPGYDGVVLVSMNDSVFAIQIENNQDKMIQNIYKGKNPDFRLYDGYLYIKDGTNISEIVL